MMRKFVVRRTILLIIVFTIVLMVGSLASGDGSLSVAASLQHYAGVKPTPFMVDFVGDLLINGKGGKTGDEVSGFQ